MPEAFFLLGTLFVAMFAGKYEYALYVYCPWLGQNVVICLSAGQAEHNYSAIGTGLKPGIFSSYGKLIKLIQVDTALPRQVVYASQTDGMFH